MNEPLIIRSYALKVPKELGEKAIRLSVRMGLFHKGLKVKLDNGDLFVPLNRKPQSSHIEDFKETLQQFNVVTQDFTVQVKRPRTAFEIAGDKLPAYLLASFPRSIDFIGNIAIVEIPQELEKHKRVIGEAILEAHKQVRTVLAKSSPIRGVRRLREYEVIAGLPETETVHKEHGCIYHLDVYKVYFSPRLSHEHHRVASLVDENETVIDMFAGVGPFSILIAKTKKDVKVYAVDVNPDAVRYLKKNILANRVLDKVVPILGDARKVIHQKLQGTANRVIMNLPEKAREYIDAACEALKPEGGIIHYYGFAEGPKPLEAAKDELTEVFAKQNRRINKFLFARTVREIAPFKWQVAVDISVS